MSRRAKHEPAGIRRVIFLAGALPRRWTALSLGKRLAVILCLLAPAALMWWLAVDFRWWIGPVFAALLLLTVLPRRQMTKSDWPALLARAALVFTIRAACVLAIVTLVLTIMVTGPDDVRLKPNKLHAATVRTSSTLKVLTLNLAHGRANGRHQALQSRAAIKRNLRAVAEVLSREAPDVVALQEADGPCLWSGRFDHVRFLADATDYATFVRAEHVRAWQTSYGTAMLSQVDMAKAESHTFDPTPPLMPKGFLVATVRWPGKPDVLVDVVSVHLDFSLSANRRKQARQLIAELSPRRRPLVLLGDFNCDFNARRSALAEMANALELSTWRRDAKDLPTFALTGKRIDWVLISRELEFVNHATLPDELSDHKAVIAELRLVEGD